MSTAAVAANLKETKEQMIFVALLAAAIIGLLGGLLLNRTIRTPLESIYEGTQLVAKGDLSQKIKIQNNDEFGQLADAFNTMTADLKRARDDLTRWSQSLEKRVVEKTDEVGRMQRQVVHVEKMASLGKLSATVAHELNNPLAAILTYAKLVDRSLPDSLTPELREELGRYLSLVQKESTRCGKIVRNLLLFARQSGGAFAPTEIRPVIDRSIMLVQHHLQMSNIILEQNLCDGDDYASCDGDQIQQALLALMMNAVEAMSGDGEGTLTIVLRGDDASMTLAIKDTGPGILDENLPHIFEPFFSTKHAESDVGLGLAVVYGIVRRHGGKIDVDSAPGQGTSFTIWLPRNPPAERPSEEGDFLV
ncbi:HAMP domain-containing protein [Myxococcota bacterium]|nr:HAMP domain-containing protein [Myxococcota bacterium]